MSHPNDVVKQIRKATRRKFSAEGKIRIITSDQVSVIRLAPHILDVLNCLRITTKEVIEDKEDINTE